MNQSPTLPEGDGLRAVVARPALLQALRDVLPAASRNSRLAILSHVLIRAETGGLSLATNNLGTGVKTWVETAAVGPAAEVCVPAHALAELVDLLPGELITLSGGTDLFGSDALAVSAGEPRFSSLARLRGLPAAEFPVEATPGGQVFNLNAETLYRSIRQVRHFVDRDERLPVLGGILLRVRAGQLTAVATDRKCLALAVEPLPLPDLELVIELEVLDVLARHLSRAEAVELELSAERVRFRLPQLEISGRLLSGDFPDYERALPREFATRAEVERLGLLALVDGAERFSRQAERVVELAVAGNGDGSGRVEVLFSHPALGSYRSRVAATVSGQPVQGRFFSQQLAQALRALPAERIALEFAAGEHAPITLRAGRNKQVLMPLAR